MLARFFNKSKPINYFLLSILLIIGMLSVGFKYSSGFDSLALLKIVGIGIFLVFLLLLLDFIIRKNNLTQANTFSIFFFSVFMLIFLRHAKTEIVTPIIFSVFFLLLAFRRIVNLQKPSNLTKKILDASVWITVAGLFYFWNILFFIPLYIAVFQLPEKKKRMYLIPFFGFLSVVSMATAYHGIFQDNVQWVFERIPSVHLDFSAYASVDVLVSLSFFVALLLWTIVSELLAFKTVSLKQRPNKRVLFIVIFTALIVVLLFPEKTGAEVMLLVPVASVVMTNYIEKNKELWFNEMILWLSLVVFVFSFFI